MLGCPSNALAISLIDIPDLRMLVTNFLLLIRLANLLSFVFNLILLSSLYTLVVKVLAIANSFITKGVNVMKQGVKNFLDVRPRLEKLSDISTQRKAAQASSLLKDPERWEVLISADQRRLLMQRLSTPENHQELS